MSSSSIWRIWLSASRASGSSLSRLGDTRGMRHRVLDEQQCDDPDDRRGTSYHAEHVLRERGPPAAHLALAIAEKTRRAERFCSFELFPTKAEGAYERFFKETRCCNPLFYALTWHEEAPNELEQFPSLVTAELFPSNTLLHLTGRGLKRSDVERILNRALELGIVNVFALQGDVDIDSDDFAHASDLVTFIRDRYGQQFCICVAGYPEMHPQSPSKEVDLFYLKTKVDAGAEFIITQFFFESQLYINFVNDCRKFGINVPIIPGIFPFTNAKLLHKMTKICRTNIPPWIEETFQQIGDNNDEAVKKFGIELSVKIIKEILDSGLSYGYHLYTLNKAFSAVEVYNQLDANKEVHKKVSESS